MGPRIELIIDGIHFSVQHETQIAFEHDLDGHVGFEARFQLPFVLQSIHADKCRSADCKLDRERVHLCESGQNCSIGDRHIAQSNKRRRSERSSSWRGNIGEHEIAGTKLEGR